MLRKILSLTLAGIAALGICSAAGASVLGERPDPTDLEKVRQNYVEAALETYEVSDSVWSAFVAASGIAPEEESRLRNMYTTIRMSDSAVDALVSKFDFVTCQWKDLDYVSRDRGSWATATHLTRLSSLAAIYRAGGQKWKGSQNLLSLIRSGLSWWYANMPQCPNWWYNDINVPSNMGRILLLLRDELTPEDVEGGLRVMEQSKFGMTGQNKVWLAANNLVRGLVLDDADLVAEARGHIVEEIGVTEEEGVQDDWSFHQHGPQNQFGNYGLSYVDAISFWYRVLSGTKYAFTDEQGEVLLNLVREGIRWCVYRGMMDPSFCGRQNFLNTGRTKPKSLAVSARHMAVALSQECAVAAGERARRLAADADFFAGIAEDGIYLPESQSGPVGAKYYPRSDCGIYRTPTWYSSVRMHSLRTIGFEFTNSENTLANFSADGAVLLLQSGREYENIFACWDWRKVPGVTAYDDGKPIKCSNSLAAKRNMSEHVAGTVAETSAGTVMAASMELSRDGLHALKSTFFFNDCIVALGAGITVANPEIFKVTTAVDQTRLVGEVTTGGSGTVSWVHHNGRGYVSLDGAGMDVSKDVQSGTWESLRPIDRGRTDEIPVFKCWFTHPMDELRAGNDAQTADSASNGGSYAYAILPCTDVKGTAAFWKMASKGRAAVKVLLNTASCQAVEYGSTVCVVSHEAGSYDIGTMTVEADRPGIIIYDDGAEIVRTDFPETIHEVAARVFGRAAFQFAKLHGNISDVEATNAKATKLYPRTLDEKGNLVTSDLKWWCSGFFPGCLWLMYEYTGDDSWKDLATEYTLPLEPLRYRTDDHDIGFQLMSSFGNGLRLTGDKSFEGVITDGAASLASRFNPTVGCVQSWNNRKWKFPVIIDNMMNLELLFAGSILSGDPRFKDIAVSHAETTMKNHFRSDFTTFHLVDYDPEDGHVIGRQTVQGLADDSAWSRGQSWALYGYTMAYRYTKDKKFLNQAKSIASCLIPRLPKDGIPYWDYDSPEIPNDLRDASAGAIMASALVELSGYVDAELATRYLRIARQIINTLSSDEYLASEGTERGFLLKHSVGNKPGDSEVDVPLTYADYYLLEAILRFLRLDY